MSTSLSNAGTIFPRMIAYGLITALLVQALPKDSLTYLKAFPEVGVWIYSLLLAFLIDKGIARKDTLRENVLLELTHLRHIHHVAVVDLRFSESEYEAIRSLVVPFCAVYTHGNFHP